MKYDFTSIIDRKGKDSIAVDVPNIPGFLELPQPKEGFDQIPMWVADMNFPTVPTVPQAIIERASHPAYGYFLPKEEYFNSIIKWQTTQNNVTGLTSENIGYENGVLGGVISALNVMCSKGDNILIHSPTYIGFTMSLKNNGYNLVHSDLVLDDDNIWRMNFEDMEKKIVSQNIHAVVFCSPHNPCGRVWEQWELEKAMELFEKYDVSIVSDEIWSDILLNGHKHIPTQLVNEYAKQNTVAIYAPSKTFNLAGLVGSYHIIYNKRLKDRVKKESSLSHYNDMNVLSMHALIGAYAPEGYEWVKELCETLSGNINYAYDFITNNFKGVSVSKAQGSYMLLLNCEEYCKANDITIEEVQKLGYEVGVVWQDGRRFNSPYGIRMNFALPLSRVEEALDRLKKYVFNK